MQRYACLGSSGETLPQFNSTVRQVASNLPWVPLPTHPSCVYPGHTAKHPLLIDQSASHRPSSSHLSRPPLTQTTKRKTPSTPAVDAKRAKLSRSFSSLAEDSQSNSLFSVIL